MKLYTAVDIAPSSKKIAYNDKLLLLGSCFADNIGDKLHAYYFRATTNPLGTLYNPASIAAAIALASTPSSLSTPHRLVASNGLWHSMLHHGSFSHPDKSIVEQRCSESINLLHEALKQASVIIVTLGTAWVYEYEGRVVANCHKIPDNNFVRRRLTTDEIVATWQPIIDAMPEKHWIFTVSPIRHIKDGLHENQLSKAILLQAIDQLLALNAQLSYFPSYEIMLDELRDYRFYTEDMVHPSDVAVDYIWQRFVDTFTSKDTQTEMRNLHQLWLDRHHRFLHPESEEAKRFTQQTQERMLALQQRYSWIL